MARTPLPALIVGIVFGSGLAISDLINPARVLAFLDVAGQWDFTLALVMASALGPSALGYAIVRRMKRPLMADTFCIPRNRLIEKQLLLGAMLFGVGWGLVGICPGPAIASLWFGLWQTWLFTGAMIGGMLVHRLVADTASSKRRAPAPERL